MPFAVFRRHQRKLLAIFAILAMFGFVVADSLPRLLNGSPTSGGDAVVAELRGGSILRSHINAMQAQRNDANVFMAEAIAILRNQSIPNFFGPLTTQAMVDAIILQRKADELAMPAGPELARDWLKSLFKTEMTPALFEAILARFNQRISGEELLVSISNQLRLRNVRRLAGSPIVTPLDVFQTYRDQNERVSTRAVAFRVADYLKNVPNPTPAQTQAYYDKYKNDLPDADRPSPGFKVPRQVQAEVLSLDGEALARSYKGTLTEPELLSYYENRKAEFKKPSELPDDLFAGHPELTPPVVQDFTEVRPYLATSLAEEKANSEIVARFERIKEGVMIPFVNSYLEAVDAQAEAAKAGSSAKPNFPKPTDLKDAAAKEGMDHEITPLLSRERAEHYGVVSEAEVGLTRRSGGRKFAEELFDPKASLYEPIELTDFTGRRFLVRKLQDVPPRVPALDEVRADVELAWKTEQARPLAERAAKEFADKVRKDGGKINGELVEGHPVVTTMAVPRFQQGLPIPGQFFSNGPAVASELPELPGAGSALRDAYFGLRTNDVAVAPNQAETAYYVLTLKEKSPAPFAVLVSPNGDYFRYMQESLQESAKRHDEEWMNELRAEAGLPAGWAPPDEAKNG